MRRSQGEHEAVHPEVKALVLAGVKPLRRGAAEAANCAIDSKHPDHGMVKIGGGPDDSADCASESARPLAAI